MPDHDCTGHTFTFQSAIGLPRSDDPLKGEKVVNFEVSKLDLKEKLFPDNRSKLRKKRGSKTLGVYFYCKITS